MEKSHEQEIPFVDPPSQDYYCPVCYELLVHPYQTRCCGNHLCYECYCKVRGAVGSCCPVCRNAGIEAVDDKFFVRVVHGLRVRCYHQRAGCRWEGELRELANHVHVTKVYHASILIRLSTY